MYAVLDLSEGKNGCQNHFGDYIRHHSIANGSLKELETHLMIVERLSYLKDQELKVTLNKCEEIDRMLHKTSCTK